METKGVVGVETIKDRAKQLQPELVCWRRWCHQHPGIGFAVDETAAYVAAFLQEWGLTVEQNVGRSGVVGIIEGGRPGPTVAVRVDMDALPIQEETGLSFSSLYPGKMHACGHDGHIAMGLGAAKLLAQTKATLQGKVVFIFQPAEEGQGGAKAMIADGVLDRHQVKGLVVGHLGLLSPELASGEVGVLAGPLMAAVNIFKAKVVGRGGHGALPHYATDPVVIGAEVILAWQRIVSREISPLLPAVLTVGQIQGGQSHNIIPDELSLQGTIRFFQPEVGKTLLTRLEEILAGVCDAWKAKYEFAIDEGYPPLVNERKFTEFFQRVAASIVGDSKVKTLKLPVMVSEDAAFFLDKVPGTYFLLGAGDPVQGYPHHHPRFDIDESVLWVGAALFAKTAWQYTQS